MILITLPAQFNEQTMYDVLYEVVDDQGVLRDNEFEFDFQRLAIIRPEGLTCIAHILELLNHRQARFVLRLPTGLDTPSIKYLDDSGFFLRFEGRKLFPSASPRNTTFPLSSLTHAESHYWLRERFIVWLADQLEKPRASLATLESCLQEIFNNIRDHSGVTIASIFAQHFPNESHSIRISISDFGIGIPSAMRSRFPSYGDAQAIEQATQEGVSSRSLPTNRGMGLDQLVRNIVLRNKGRVVIHSGHGKLICRQDTSDNLERIPGTVTGYYPGTLIALYFSAETFVPDEVEREDFEW
ncbi:MAG: sensor histidine kinase [Alphaproteobacteria bacterium]|nr:sensor histidine kinase [Alphaproteobacteria bacterium]